MKKENLERMLENMLSTGGDFAEIFLEDKKLQYITMLIAT